MQGLRSAPCKGGVGSRNATYPVIQTPLAGGEVIAPLLPYPFGTQGFGPEGLEAASEIRGGILGAELRRRDVSL